MTPPPADRMCGALAEPEHREDIQFEGKPHIRHRHVEGLRSATAGVVDQDGELTESVNRSCHSGLQVGLPGDIAGRADRSPASRFDGFPNGVCGRRISIRDNHRRTGGGKGLSNGTADAGARASDECDAFVESEVCWIVHRDSSSERW